MTVKLQFSINLDLNFCRSSASLEGSLFWKVDYSCSCSEALLYGIVVFLLS